MKIFIIGLFLLLSSSIFAQTWKNDKNHSRLGFTITHLQISSITGTFNNFEATIISSRNDFSDAVFELVAESESIDTKVPERDAGLKSEQFFDVKNFPLVTFKSSSIRKIVKNKYTITGNLTMHGITKEVTADFIYKGTITNPKTKNITAGFHLTAILKRSDFKIGPAFPKEEINELVLVEADGEFIRQ